MTHRLPGGKIMEAKVTDIAETLYSTWGAGAISLLSWGVIWGSPCNVIGPAWGSPKRGNTNYAGMS